MFACLSSPASPPASPPASSSTSSPASSSPAFSPPYEARGVLERVARDFSPRVELSPDGSVLLDVSGLHRLLGEPSAIGHELWIALARANPAQAVQVALASTRIAARLLGRARSGLTIVESGTEREAIASLPLTALSDLGAQPDLLATLARWGLATLGAFAALPAAPLSARLGEEGVRWQRIARGDDPRPLVPTVPDEPFEDTLDFDWPIEGVEPLAFALGRLLDALCERLERRGRAAAALTLQLREAVARSWDRRRLELPAASRDVRMLRTLLCLNLEGRPPVGGIDRVGIFIEPTPARVCQFSLLAPPTLAPEQSATLMARLRALMGQDRCGVPLLVDTHRPGAFDMSELNPVLPAHGHPKRLVLGRSLRRLRHPIPARVVLEHGRPVRVTTDRRGWNGGRVLWASGPWRSSGDWWRTERTEPTERTFGPWSQQAWDVALSDGGLYRVYEDRLSTEWLIEAVID